MAERTTRRATMQDVARLADVSKATVSAVLNSSSDVREHTRERVMSAIALLNYRAQHAPPRRDRAKRGTTLGLVIKEVDNPYYAEVVLGAREIAEHSGYMLIVASSEGEHDAECRAVHSLRANGIDGIMLTPVLDETADLAHLFDLKRRNIPLVLLERVRGLRASLVDVDNVSASRRAADHLIERGHTRLAHFAGPPYSMHSRERIDGVRLATSATSQIMLTENDIVFAGAHLTDGYRAAMSYFAGRRPSERATGITCYNDLVAIGVCRALSELGLRVPTDVSVVGFDDIALAEYASVPLTTVRMPKRQMGARAASMLIQQIESRTVLAPQSEMLEADVVERESVAVPNENSVSARRRRHA
ncbi:MAG TPA: LacI family DNA-binding transcriptional regulator [Gemmatimonadaceae bacterium]|nr:LacI family DNA-binding transcriptional regulator [Gemmatimonadaceae bacterium]